MEEVKVKIGIDDKGFATGLQRDIRQMEQLSATARKGGMSIDDMGRHVKQLGRDIDAAADKGVAGFSRLEKAAIGFFTIQKAKEFIGKVYEVRSEIEKLETSFRILVGNRAEADALFASIRKFAVETPMQLKDLAGAAQTMMGFGIAAGDVMENLKALGNVAMGDSQKFQSLALAFSQMSATGKLMGQDFLQMVNAGFNPLDQMAKTTGKSVAELKKEMSEGAISADMVRQAFIDATSEGGKFNGMLEAQSKTMAGAYSNLQGAIDDMLNEIGEKSEGVFSSVIEGATDLVKNYKKVAAVIQDLVVAYGLYKTALMTAHAIEKASVRIKQEMAVQEALLTAEAKKLAAARGISVAAAKAELGSVNLLTAAKIRLTAATKSLTAAMMANPYVAVAMAVAGLCFGIYKLATAEDAETAARRRANDEMKKFSDQLDEQKNKIQGYIQTLQDSNATEYQKAVAWEMLNKLAPSLCEKYGKAGLAALDLGEATKEVNEQMEVLEVKQYRDKVSELQSAIEKRMKDLQYWQKELEKYKNATGYEVGSDDYDKKSRAQSAIRSQQAAIARLNTELSTYLNKLAEIDRIRKKIAEDNKPLEIRIQEANENAEAKAGIYNFYKRAADLAGELKTAHDIAAGTIANSSIPQDYEAIAESAREKYDALIAELEEDVRNLRTRIAESPASLELEDELKGKEQALNDLLQMKREWAWSGATTIPLTFHLNFQQVEKALQAAQNGVGRNTDGMKWVENSVEIAGGHWEKDDAHADTRTAAQWRRDAYGKWKQAQKAVDEFWQKKESMDKATFDKEYDRLKGIADQAKKDYDRLNGCKGRSASRAAEEAASRREKLFEQELAEVERQAQQLEAMKDALSDADIAKEQNRAKRELMQAEKDHQDRLDAIDQQAEEMRKANYEAQKKAWETSNTDKTKNWSDTDLAKAVAEQGYKVVELTEAQNATLKARREQANADYDRLVRERMETEEKANREAINTYLKQYGDYAQKRQAIYDDANAEICELEKQLSAATTAEARAAVQARIDTVKAGTKEQIEELDQQYGNAKQFMIDLFGDASKKSVAEIEKIIKKYEELEKFLQGNSSVSRKSLIDLGFTEKEIDQALEKLSQGKITVKDFTDSLKSMREELAERSPWQKYKKDIGDALKMLKEADGDSGKIGTAIQNIGSACSEYLPQVEKFATGLYSLFGIDDSGAKGAISAMQGLSVVAQGVGQIISGEFMDGLVNAVDGAAQAFNGLAEMINDISTSRDMEAEYDNIELKAIRKAVDKIVEKFDNDSMAQAMADYEQAMKLYEDELKKAQETLRGAFSKSSSDLRGRYNHHSINYYMNDFGGQAEFDAINQLLGTNVQGWGDLWFLSPDQLAEIETRLPRIFAIIQKGIAEMSSNASASSHDEEAQAALDAYMELAGQKEKIEDAFNLKMTGTSFDSVKSDFKNMLADMTSDTEAFGEKIQDILLNSVANQLMSDRYSAELEEWYKSFKNAYKNDGKLDEDEVRELRESYQRTAEEALKDRDALMSIIGDTSEAKKYFDNLRDMWLTTLTDMKADAKDWEKEILRIMVEDLISTTVLNEGFTAWLVDWKKRYTELMKAEANHEINQQERDRRMQELLDEQIDKREQLAGQAKEIMDSLGYTEMLEEADDAFDDLRDQFVDALMDMDTDAEEWGRKIAQTIARQFIEQELLNEAFGGMLDEWKADVAELMEHGFGQGSREDTEAIERLKGKVQELVNKYKELAPLAQEFMEAIGLGKEADSATSPFKDLRTSFVNTLMDMQTDAESFRKQLQKTLTQHLMEGLVDNFTVGDLGFNEWLKKWNDEYMQTFNNLDNPDREEDLDWYINELVKVYGQLLGQSDELRERLKELAEDTTFKDMTSGWVSSLMDFNATAEDWAEDIGRTMAQKIIEQMIVPTLVQPLLDTLQAAFDTALKAQEESNTDWSAVINADGVQTALKAIQDAYPELKETVTKILAALNITPEVEAAKEAFGDLTGTIVSGLTDAEMTAEEFSKNIARTLTEQLMKQIVESQFAETMKGIQEDWAKALESGDTSAIEAIRQRIVQLYKDAGRATDELRGIFEEVKEGDTTFKDMADTWVSALFDMDSTASDFGRKIGRTLVEKLVKELVVTKHLQKYLDDIQTAFDNAIGKEGATIESVLAAVIPAIDAAVAETEKWKPVVEEIAKRFEELDKSTPLDNIRSNFLSQLMDMKSDTKDFAQSISEILTEAFIDRFVLGDEFDKRLEEWKSEYASIMGGNYSEEKRAELLNQLKRAITVARDGYAEEAKIIHDLMGTATYADQTATMNMSDKATQEQMDQYLGVQMGIYMVTEQILTTLRGGTTIDIPAVTLSSFSMATETTAKQILSAIHSMKAVTNPDSGTILEMRNMMATGNEYLLDIKRSNRDILTQFGAVLNSINGKLAKL